MLCINIYTHIIYIYIYTHIPYIIHIYTYHIYILYIYIYHIYIYIYIYIYISYIYIYISYIYIHIIYINIRIYIYIHIIYTYMYIYTHIIYIYIHIVYIYIYTYTLRAHHQDFIFHVRMRSQKRALVAAPFEHKPTDSQTHSPLPNCEETNCNGLWNDASYVLCALAMWTPYSAKTCLATVGGVLEAFSLSSFSRALANTFVFGQSAQRVVVTS